MAHDDVDPFLEPDEAADVLRGIEQRDAALAVSPFLGNTHMARDRASSFLPDFVDRVGRIMAAKVVPQIDKRTGLPVATLPEQDENGLPLALDKTQLEFGRILLNKLLPPPVPVEAAPARNGLTNGDVRITINNIGGNVDFNRAGGSVEGVLSGEARHVGEVIVGVADPDEAPTRKVPMFRRVTQLPPRFKRTEVDSLAKRDDRRSAVMTRTTLIDEIAGGR